ncbi:hypothetical protein SDC9_45872 [bioreactor metagenome]|uniref:Uncharacterized protein n=1 Tax=bioreactor metagenome TaxID=1076179 RepID=A0A644WB71_9ZZZZ
MDYFHNHCLSGSLQSGYRKFDRKIVVENHFPVSCQRRDCRIGQHSCITHRNGEDRNLYLFGSRKRIHACIADAIADKHNSDKVFINVSCPDLAEHISDIGQTAGVVVFCSSIQRVAEMVAGNFGFSADAGRPVVNQAWKLVPYKIRIP